MMLGILVSYALEPAAGWLARQWLPRPGGETRTARVGVEPLEKHRLVRSHARVVEPAVGGVPSHPIGLS